MAGRPRRLSARPILVTGMPRSGTTWLARLLASAPGTALTGREPMNPHPGQYALARTVAGWTEVVEPSARQARAMRRAYSGRTPFVFGRYGRRQWAAPAPWTRLVVKDPYALLSIPALTRITGASPVVVFRHPAAALVSYRRMGWQPSLAEVHSVQQIALGRHVDDSATPAALLPDGAGQAETVARLWSALYGIALDQAAESADPIIVSHEELSGGGVEGARVLFDRLDLRWSAEAAAEMSRNGASADPPTATAESQRELHQFDRAPGAVATAYRGQLDADDFDTVERIGREVYQRLLARRLPLSDSFDRSA